MLFLVIVGIVGVMDGFLFIGDVEVLLVFCVGDVEELMMMGVWELVVIMGVWVGCLFGVFVVEVYEVVVVEELVVGMGFCWFVGDVIWELCLVCDRCKGDVKI